VGLVVGDHSLRHTGLTGEGALGESSQPAEAREALTEGLLGTTTFGLRHLGKLLDAV
jgi:hypothetical protein